MPHSAELLQRTGWTRPLICQHHKYTYCPSHAVTNAVTNRILRLMYVYQNISNPAQAYLF